MKQPRIYLKAEGWYFICVILFVLGGAVLRQVNLLVGMAGLMAAVLFIHYQLVLQALSRCSIERVLPSRICVGDTLAVEVQVQNHHAFSSLVTLEFRESIQRQENTIPEDAIQVVMLFPEIRAGEKQKQSYECLLTQRGIYSFSHVELRSRYPFGLLEGICTLNLPDKLVVCPHLGLMSRSWRELIDAEYDGQQRSKHRRGLMEADFYALREWRNGDSRRWIHWRTSAKLGTLSVRQFEQRKSCDLALVMDLWLPPEPTVSQLAQIEQLISFAATAVNDLATHGGAHLTLILAGKSLGCWDAAASSLFVQELLEQLAICDANSSPNLVQAAELWNEHVYSGTQTILLSTRSRAAAQSNSGSAEHLQRLLGQALWLQVASPEFKRYFSCHKENMA